MVEKPKSLFRPIKERHLTATKWLRWNLRVLPRIRVDSSFLKSTPWGVVGGSRLPVYLGRDVLRLSDELLVLLLYFGTGRKRNRHSQTVAREPVHDVDQSV